MSHLYPAEPALSATFGSVSGRVTNGANGLPVLGAHVYAVDPATQASVVGSFSADDVAAKEKFEKRRAPQFFAAFSALYADRPFAVGETPRRARDQVALGIDTNGDNAITDIAGVSFGTALDGIGWRGLHQC